MNRIYTKEENTARANEVLYNSKPFIVRLFTKLDRTKPIPNKYASKLCTLDYVHHMEQAYLKNKKCMKSQLKWMIK